MLIALALILWPVVMGPKRDQSFVIESDIPEKPAFGPSEIKQPVPRTDLSPIGGYQQKIAQQQEQPPEPEPARRSPALDDDGIPIGWEIQVGSFGNIENARKLKQRLQDLGYRPQLARTGELTRVFIGPYIDKHIAQRNLDRIAKQKDLKPRLVRFSPPNE